MPMGVHECMIVLDFQLPEDILKIVLELYKLSQQLPLSVQMSHIQLKFAGHSSVAVKWIFKIWKYPLNFHRHLSKIPLGPVV